jgi:uncharacterized integral membrane protein
MESGGKVMMHWLKRIVLLCLLLCVGVFAIVAVNQEPVKLRFLMWESPQWSVFWWLLVAFVTGGLIGHLLALLSTIPLRLENRRLLKTVQKNEASATLTTDRATYPAGSPPISPTSSPTTPPAIFPTTQS